MNKVLKRAERMEIKTLAAFPGDASSPAVPVSAVLPGMFRSHRPGLYQKLKG
jgi:hypothetical protein